MENCLCLKEETKLSILIDEKSQEMCGGFQEYHVEYLFIGKFGAILYGYPGTTQDMDIFPLKSSWGLHFFLNSDILKLEMNNLEVRHGDSQDGHCRD